MSEKQIEELKKLAAKFDADLDPGEYWDSGNFDDCYQVGVGVGENNVYEEIKSILDQP